MYSVAACLLISVTLTVGAPERQRVQRQTGTCSVRDPDINGFPARNYIAGQAYVLICQCSGLGVVQDSVTVFNWYKNGGKLSESGENITFSSLRLSDAAEYTCNATAGNMIHESSGDSYTITVQIPAPSYVIMRSDKINPIRPIGANVTLTCIVGLQSLVADSEIQLTVDILLSGPNGRALGATVLPMSKSSYISTAVIYSFDRHDSGAYICAATLASASPFLTESSTLIEELTLISGVYLLQNGVGIQNNTCISTHNNGSSSPHQLACVSDRVPCCDGSPQHGRWHDEHGLPVDSNIFHINRTDEGHINLTVFRVPDEIVGYGGKICCTVDDFTGVFHTACINLVPSIVVTVTDNGSSPIAGSDYSLTCDVSGAEVESFIWRKDGVAMHNIGSILKFSPLNFSDTGEYSCHVSIDEACELSGKKTVQVQVTPPSSVKITSYPPTPIQPIGASVTINCTVELSWPIYDTLMIIRLTHPEGSTLASSSVSAGSTVHTLITEVASFQRNDSGTYNCTATISSRSTSGVANIFIGMYTSFLGKVLQNNSVVYINDIGRYESDVTCTTGRIPCCRTHKIGEWYFPNGNQVLSYSAQPILTVFHRNRNDDGDVNLYRRVAVVSPLGQFCCKIPDFFDTNHTLCVNILSIKISEKSSPVGGMNYSLYCDILGAELSTMDVTFNWTKSISFGDQVQVVGDSRTLSFSPLSMSDAGKYNCTATFENNLLLNSGKEVSVQFPAPEKIAIMSSQHNPINPVGSNITLKCSVELSSAIDVSVNVAILIRGPSGTVLNERIQLSADSANTSVNALINSFANNHSGLYNCTAFLSSMSSLHRDSSESVSESIVVTTGAYLSYNQKVIDPTTDTIFITNIGTSLTNQLVCSTDRKSCCHGEESGGWYYPNGSKVLESTESGMFYTISNEGDISLRRVNRNVTSPIGLFCCKSIDLLDTNHTLCVNVHPRISASITARGSPRAGQDYRLICNVTMSIKYLNDALITYKWIKTNGSHITSTRSNVLSFSSLRLSDGGTYLCEISVNSNVLIKNATTTVTHEFDVTIPQPNLELISDTPNPVLSGTSLTLICIVELHPAIDIPVDVDIKLTSPGGSILVGGHGRDRVRMTTPSLYTSRVVLSDIGVVDEGLYTCSVNIRDGISMETQKRIEIGGNYNMFQLRMKYTDDCRQWYKSSQGEIELYKYHIEEALVNVIKLGCECYFPKKNLIQASFSCAWSPSLTTYRASLIGTHNFNASQLVGFIQDWVNSQPRITIKDTYSVWLDKSCPVAVSSYHEPECGEYTA